MMNEQLQTSTVMPTAGAGAPQPSQTPQSQYLAAALHALQQQPAPTSAGGVAGGLMAQALMKYAQSGQYGPDGGNAQKNAMTDQMNAGLQSIGQSPVSGSPLPTTAPPQGGWMSGLMGLGKQAMSMFGGGGG